MVTIEIPLDTLNAFAELKFPPRMDKRLQELMDRNSEGRLSDAEREDLAALVELSEELSLVRAQAMHALGRRPQ